MNDQVRCRVYTGFGQCFDGYVLMEWRADSPMVLSYRMTAPKNAVHRTWEAGLPQLVEAIGDGHQEIEAASRVQIWKSHEFGLSFFIRFDDDRWLIQIPLAPVVAVLQRSFDSMEPLGGPEQIEERYREGGLAALEMLANGGLK
jgi:hypothetical protein